MDENSYYNAVIKDAIKELNKKGCSYVFTEEQVQEMEKIMGDKITIELDRGLFKVILKK